MSPFRRFLRLLESFAIPNISLYLVIGQVAVFGMEFVARKSSYPLWLIPANVLAGEWWRVLTFVLVPPDAHPVFIAFAWYLFWMMGSALEANWGVGKYNAYLFTGWALTVALAFLSPMSIATNAFLAGSVFLAFAWFAPNFELAIFFVLPVKIKWLALITWVFYAYTLIAGDWSARLGVFAATGNFLIFFSREIWQTVRQHQRRMGHESQRLSVKEDDKEPHHRCKVCGKDSNAYPDLDFRYCSKCADDSCYCQDHIRDHEHVTEVPEQTPPGSQK